MPTDTYTAHTWTTAEPITADKMNALEQAVATADYNSKDNIEKITTIKQGIGYTDTELLNSSGARTIKQRITDLSSAINNLDIPDLSSVTSDVNYLKTQVNDARNLYVTDSNSSLAMNIAYVKNLADAAQGTANSANTKADAVTQEVNQAHRDGSDTLSARFGSIEELNGTQNTRIGNLETEMTGAHASAIKNISYTTVDDRLEAIESEIVLARTAVEGYSNADNTHTLDYRFDQIETELLNARSGSTDLDTRLDGLEGNTTNLANNKLDKSAVANNLTTTNEGYVLDARQGKALNDAKVNITDIVDNLTSENTDKPLSANQGYVLKGLIDTVDSAYQAADTALETSITTAYQAADSALNTKIETIATELGMLDNGTISDLNTRVDTIANDLDTAEDNISTLQSNMSTAQGDISNINTALASKADSSDLTTLAGRVTTLENNPQSNTVVIEQVTYNNDGIPTSINSPSSDIDYLLKKDDQYYYWKYINNTWELISGGGGSGTSSAEFYAALTDVVTPSDTVDYFIGSGANYIHYRYNNGWVMILPNHLVNSVSVDISTVGEGQNPPTKSRPIIKELNSNINLLADFMAIKSIAYETTEEGTKLIWTNIDGEVEDVTITGGGGGSGSSANATITRVTDGNITTIAGETCEINYKFYATDASGDALATTSNGVWTVNRVQVATSTVYVNNPSNANDYNTFDITQYLRNGENNITLTVNTTVDDQIISRTKTWAVTVVNFSLVWDYDESTINEGATINFSCVPYGIDITKTLHLRVGNTEQTQTVTTSGIPVTVTLTNNFNHGTYTAEMWMTATINGEAETTNHIFHDFLVVESGSNTPIIAATLPVTTMNQYNTISIPFVVYTPNSNTSNVSLAVDGTVVDTREVGRTTQTWHYTPLTSGAKVLTITTGSVTKTLNLTVNSININNAEIGGYTFKLKASELASNNALQNWYYDNNNPTTTKLQFSNNFDWVNGGIKTEYDENDQLRQYIRIKSGTTMTIPYKMFATDPRTNGANFKIIFKIDNCRDYDATIATNITDNIGIQLNAHSATFQSTTTSINTQYGEEEYTELEFEVYKSLLPNGTDAPNQYMMAWIDGVIATARAYGGNFVQTNPANFVIGSTDCDVCVYLVKYYPTVLSRNDHISNFIADAPNAVEMIQRYNRNDILDADEDIDYEKVAQKNPDCRVWLYDISRMTKAKDDSIDVYNFQQIWEGGDQYYQLTGTNAKLKIQGTSSVNYRYGAANTDIDFRTSKAPNATLVDGYGNNLLDDNLEVKGFKINDTSVPIEYSNTKVNFASCEQVNNMCNAEWYQRYQPFPSLSPRDCMEFAMGVQFIKDRHENEPSDGIDLFTEKGASFNPEKYYMYSIANMGTSKKNTHIFHSENECCIEIKENTSDTQKMKSFDSAWTDTDKNTQNYEMRYPDIKPTQVPNDIKTGWARFVNWMVASNPGAATNAALAEPVTFAPYTFRGHNRTVTETEGRHFEQVLRGSTVSQYAGTYDHDTFEYRMAKMLSECEDYMAMDSVIYHFCFIERHTMVDNVAKNTFWSSLKENGGPNNESGYWIWDLSKNYDNDTSDGNNNNGLLVFDYGNEASDTRDGTPVFNGYDTVWFVFASNLYEACQTMFTNREAIGAWNSVTYHNYLLSEQRKVPERIWNECYWYDYLRTYENNIETTWINFLDGGQKTHQRKHYETYEEIYDSSKYRGSLSHNQAITLRGEAIDYQTLNLPPQESKFTITMFNKCYLTIWIGTNYQTVKCAKGVPVTLYFYEDNDPSKGYMSLANSVIDIDSGSMVQAIGDLSLIYPSSGQFGAAKRLRSLQIGSDTAGYYNPNMNNNSVLTFNNKMLEYLYVQNLPQATYNLDLTNCPELKFLKASGSGFTGFEFANGGLLNEVYINQPTSLVMRNLNSLTNANFHLTDATAVTQLRLEGCRLFDKLTFIESLTNLNVLRLTDINWTLSNSTLLDNLLNMMGINESGYTISQSYLAGTVTLLGTVYQGTYNKYLTAWSPDLTIDVSQSSFVYQHLVTYQNDDGSKLYDTYINNGDYLIDPYAAGLLQSTPTKNADIQYIYTFGKIDSAANYISFSGWREISKSQSIYDEYQNTSPNITITSPTTLVAVYRTTPQSYTVRWLVRENQVVATAPGQRYGGGLDLIAPTIKEVQTRYPTYTFSSNGNLCTYSIMTGWEKLPINITPAAIGATYDIYATWLERTNVDYQTVLSSDEYSVEEKLLVLKEFSSARSIIDIGDKYDITLGYDGIKAPDYELANAPKRFTGNNTETLNNYTPFAVNQTFTMMIDYKFEPQTSIKDELILLSCYENNNDSSQGFKLFYKPNNMVPQISLGSTAQSTTSNVCTLNSDLNNRGIIVIRRTLEHPDQLYIYTGSDNGGLKTTYSRDAFKTTLTWSAIGSNAKIVVGGINTSDTSVANATGILYSVKYWNEDLGEGECLQLASWCHENMTFAIADYTEADVHSSKNETLTSTLVLHTLNASQMGTVTEPTYSAARIGWDPSTVRDFYNNRIYNGFPTLLQSIMAPVSIAHRKAYRDTNEGRYVIENTGSNTTQDYVFAPSRIEVGGYNANYTIEASGQFSWCNASQMKVMSYNNNNLQEVSGSINYTNLRFPYCYNRLNNTDVTIYINYPQEGRSFYEWANEHITGGLKIGDILIPQDSSVAYIYVPSTEINKGAPVTTDNYTCLSNTIGGWITSTGWWTRSVIASAYQSSIAKFIYVTNSGAVVGDEGGRISTHGLVYSIGL